MYNCTVSLNCWQRELVTNMFDLGGVSRVEIDHKRRKTYSQGFCLHLIVLSIYTRVHCTVPDDWPSEFYTPSVHSIFILSDLN